MSNGFVEWAHKTPFFGNPRFYLSLGVKEKNAPDRRMAAVEDATREIAGLLDGKGFDVTFEMVPGTHFSPAAPKFERALEILLAEGGKTPVTERIDVVNCKSILTARDNLQGMGPPSRASGCQNQDRNGAFPDDPAYFRMARIISF